jgi:hypothetical protein
MANNLKLENYSDRELLYILNDLSPTQGEWVETHTIAERIGLQRDGLSDEQYVLHAQRCVSVRFSWIARLSGCVEKDPDRKQGQAPRWRLTLVGKQVVNAKLSTATMERLEEGLSDYATLHALDALSRRYRATDSGVANLMRREWAYGIHRKRRS